MAAATQSTSLARFIGVYRRDVLAACAAPPEALPPSHRALASFLAALPTSLYDDATLRLSRKLMLAAPTVFSDAIHHAADAHLPPAQTPTLTDADRLYSGGYLAVKGGDVFLHLARRPRARIMQAIDALESAGHMTRVDAPVGRRYRLAANDPELACCCARQLPLRATAGAAALMAESELNREAMFESRRRFEDVTGLHAIPRLIWRARPNIVFAQYAFDGVINGEVESFPYQQFDPDTKARCFQVLLSSHVNNLAKLIERHAFTCSADLLDQLHHDVESFWSNRPAAISAHDEHLIWRPVAPHPDFQRMLARLPDSDWGYQSGPPGDNSHGAYHFRASVAAVDLVDVIRGMGYSISQPALDLVETLAEKSRARWNRAHSQAIESDTVYDGLALPLLPHQAAAADYIVANRATLLAMDTGTGKTPTPLAAAEKVAAYPLVIVTTATMKLLFAQEVEKFLPHRSVIALGVKNTKARREIEATGLETADVIVINYELLAKYLERLIKRRPKMLVADESHYAKDESAKRTQALEELSRRARFERIVLASATPMKHRPEELVSQLAIMGVIDQFGGAEGFRSRYCGPTQVKVPFRNPRTGRVSLSKIRQYKGATNLDELNMMLRSTCMVRCDKREVLKNLQPKSRVTLPIPLDGVRSYQKALKAATQAAHERRSVRQRLGIDISDGAVVSAADFDAYRQSGAAELTRIGELREAVGTGKLAGICRFIDDFVAGSDERLVVFAIHKQVQQGVLAHLESNDIGFGTILDTDSQEDRLATVNAFQAEQGPQVLLCSFEAAQEALTLTAAHTALMCEYGWSPYDHVQAEDRLWRISQTNAVSVLYAHAPDTIDDQMRALILDKLDDIDRVLNERGDRDLGFFADAASDAQANAEHTLIRHLLEAPKRSAAPRVA